MNLVEVYVEEVARRLPEKAREDIALELQSTIEDMLPVNYTEADVKIVLSKLGDPVALANQYREKPAYLIGPNYYDLYITTLKMVMPISLLVAMIIFTISEFAGFTASHNIFSLIIGIFGNGFWLAFSISIQVLFWVTLIFFILERSGVSPVNMTATGKEWNPEDLKNITSIPKKKAISKGEVFCSFLWTAIWATVYFNAMHFFGVYESGEGLRLITPVLNQTILQSYWPVIVIFIGFEVALAIFKWITGQWTIKLAIINATYQLLYTILFIVIILDQNFFAPSFISYVSELLAHTTLHIEQLINWFLGTAIVSAIVATAISSIDGFRKARIRNK